MLFSSSSCQARRRPEMANSSQATATPLYEMNSDRAKQYLWIQHCVVNPQGKTVNLKYFL